MNRLKSRQNRKMRKLEALLALIAASFYVLCFLNAAVAGELEQGAIGPFSPLKPEDRHGAYLEDLHSVQAERDLEPESYNSAIFEKSIADEMTEKFKSFNDAYEARAAFQLNDRGDYLRYRDANKELADWTLKKLIQWHIDHTIKDNLEKSMREKARASRSSRKGVASGGNVDQAAANTVMALSAVSKAIRGTSFRLGDQFKARFKYDLAGGNLTMGLANPIADATVDYNARTGTRQIGRASDAERMSIRLVRHVAEIGATTEAQFGLLSRTINYGVYKSLVGPLSAAVNQAHNMGDNSKDETVFRLDLGTHF